MASVSFKGNVGKVRGLQFSNDGKPRFSFSVAEGHGRFDKQTNQWTDTGVTWWNVTVFGRDAKAVAEVVMEGAKQRVLIQGSSETREYEVNGGETRTSLDVIADSVGVIPKAQPQQQGGGNGGQQQQSQSWGGNREAGIQHDGNPPF